MGVKSDLLDIFDEMGYPAWLMHTMPASQVYPESFFTFLTTDAPFEAHYDNQPHSVVWAFEIGFYSSDPEKVERIPLELTKRLRAAGWVVPGVGSDAMSDEPTHTGWHFTAWCVQPINNEEV